MPLLLNANLLKIYFHLNISFSTIKLFSKLRGHEKSFSALQGILIIDNHFLILNLILLYETAKFIELKKHVNGFRKFKQFRVSEIGAHLYRYQ